MVRQLGPALFYVRTNALPDFGESEAKALLPLLRKQPYIIDAKLSSGEPFEYDLDNFHNHANAKHNLADSHLEAFDLPLTLRDSAWISVPEKAQVPGRPVVFARTQRYRGAEGFWRKCHELFGQSAVFAGTPEEHMAYEREVGQVPFVQTSDLLELACLIAGAKLFVGNQSCAFAIAEGLKQNAVLEVCTGIENCMFRRPNLLTVTDIAQL